MYFTGLALGAASFLIIGLFHPLVIGAEYRWGVRPWPVFLAAGVAGVAASAFVPNALVSGLLAIFGFSCLWTIRELFEQAERVRKGWFPRNPARADEYGDADRPG